MGLQSQIGKQLWVCRAGCHKLPLVPAPPTPPVNQNICLPVMHLLYPRPAVVGVGYKVTEDGRAVLCPLGTLLEDTTLGFSVMHREFPLSPASLLTDLPYHHTIFSFLLLPRLWATLWPTSRALSRAAHTACECMLIPSLPHKLSPFVHTSVHLVFLTLRETGNGMKINKFTATL